MNIVSMWQQKKYIAAAADAKRDPAIAVESAAAIYSDNINSSSEETFVCHDEILI